MTEARDLYGEISRGWYEEGPDVVDWVSGALGDICLGKGHLVALRVRAK